LKATLTQTHIKKSTYEKALRKRIAIGVVRKRIAIGVVIFGIACLVTVWQRVTVEETYREIGELEKELRALEDRNAELEVTFSRLCDFRRLCKIAEEEKSLVFPPRVTVTIPSKYMKLIKENDKVSDSRDQF